MLLKSAVLVSQSTRWSATLLQHPWHIGLQAAAVLQAAANHLGMVPSTTRTFRQLQQAYSVVENLHESSLQQLQTAFHHTHQQQLQLQLQQQQQQQQTQGSWVVRMWRVSPAVSQQCNLHQHQQHNQLQQLPVYCDSTQPSFFSSSDSCYSLRQQLHVSPIKGLLQQRVQSLCSASSQSANHHCSSSSSSRAGSTKATHRRSRQQHSTAALSDGSNTSSSSSSNSSSNSSSSRKRRVHSSQDVEDAMPEQVQPDTSTSTIQSSNSLQELQSLLDQHSNAPLKQFNAAAAIIQVCRLYQHQQHQQHHQQQRAPQGQQDTISSVLARLCRLLKQQLPDVSASEIAAIIHVMLTEVPAAIRQQHQEQVMGQLLLAFLRQLEYTQPQDLSTILRAIAVGADQPLTLSQGKAVQRMITRLVIMKASATPHDISKSLWAVSSMAAQHPGRVLAMRPMAKQLQLLLQEMASEVDSVQPQDASLTLLACARWCYLPRELLANQTFSSKFAGWLEQANTQQLANTAWSLGRLGYQDEQLMGLIIQQLQQKLQARAQFRTQELCNPAWAIAVLDMPQFGHTAVHLADACSSKWDRMLDRHMRQLYQVHWWLKDIQYDGGHGLEGVLTAKQLRQCKAAWGYNLQPLAAGPGSALHKVVLAAVRKLPIEWQHGPKYELLSPDGLILIDIAAQTVAGRWLAIEVDGPSHFRWREKAPTGSTLWRNRALLARGYTVVSLPDFELEECWTAQQLKHYLMNRLQAAGATATPRRL